MFILCNCEYILIPTLRRPNRDLGILGLNLNIESKGASTSRPYSFTKRVWGVRNIKVTNFLDILSDETTIELQNNEIIRILPLNIGSVARTVASNSQSILDKLRFSIDAFRMEENLSKSSTMVHNWESKTTFKYKLSKFFKTEEFVERSVELLGGVPSKYNLHTSLTKSYLSTNTNKILNSGYDNPVADADDSLKSSYYNGLKISIYKRIWLNFTNREYHFWHHTKPSKSILNECIMYNTLLASKNILYTLGHIKNVLFKNRGNFDDNSIFHSKFQDPVNKSSMVLVGIETRFDIPAPNMCTRRNNGRITVYNYGHTLFTNTKVYNLGFNYDQLSKLSSNKHYVSITESYKNTTKWLVNSQFEGLFIDYVSSRMGLLDLASLTTNFSYINRVFENLKIGAYEFLHRKNKLMDAFGIVYMNNTSYGQSTSIDPYRPYKYKKYINYLTESSVYYGSIDGRKCTTTYTFHQPTSFYHNSIGYNINVEGEFKLQFEDLSFRMGGDGFMSEFFTNANSTFGSGPLNHNFDPAKWNLYMLYKKTDLKMRLVYNKLSPWLEWDIFIAKSTMNIYTSNPYRTNSFDECSYFMRNYSNFRISTRRSIHQYIESY
jgi:hypothetical protein